ncbi:sigma-70 family RNA polymerase sigma factor [Aeromicrobium ginsengisoli]|uniref:Sigma-70 family RNA polymerase sigma factor n=1 Tax=Aeromicrobium ginsengisoli TaxID=363867 RepID=A0A5M4FIM5_9ACTN|nr:sigma-70 family RNA polymerase sigma factor [Aeromicrobium ginsengisoli]KAA1399425.1 sigma-70 family RNA polymerase sigma factor [Aeromicrobium ginsengisoli]
MSDTEFLAERFEHNRDHLRAVAYRMLGSLTDAEDAVQESWIRLSRVDADDIDNLGGWLTTVVGRVCLDMLRSRKTRGEQPLDVRPNDPVSTPDSIDPEHEAELVDSVGLAMLVVLEKLTPAERLAFVLHDMFAVPFDDIAAMIGRTPDAARQLASRARRRVQGSDPETGTPLPQQREIVDAFISAARGGDFEALVTVLDPDVVLRADTGHGPPVLVRGARNVASGAISFRTPGRESRPVLVEGGVGIVAVENGRIISVLRPSFADGRIATIDITADPDRAAAMEVEFLD